MEAKESIEIPFGAFDSELKGWEYTIPEGMKARIEGNKIILEPKESEDERIRKWLIGYFNQYIIDEMPQVFGNGLNVKDVIAWLEKQGEQNPKSADFIPTDCTSDAKNENRWHKVEDSLPDNNREVLCKDAIGNFFIGRYYNNGDYWEVSMYDEPDKSNEDNPPVIMWMDILSCEQDSKGSYRRCVTREIR